MSGYLRDAMSLIAYIIMLACSGLFIGALARLALPGPDPMSITQTILLGLAGNLIAGIVVWLVWRHTAPGVVLSVACSSLILYGDPPLARREPRSTGAGLSRPGRAAPDSMSDETPRTDEPPRDPITR